MLAVSQVRPCDAAIGAQRARTTPRAAGGQATISGLGGLSTGTKSAASAPDRTSKIANWLPLVTQTKDISTTTWL
jgi:hypothetical protein